VEFLDAFATWLRPQRQPLTITTYIHSLRHFIAWLTTNHAMPVSAATITAWDVVQYRTYLQEATPPRSAATINKVLSAINAWITWAVATGQRSDNPMHGIRRVGTVVETAPKGLNPAEQAQLLRWASETRHPVRDATLLILLLQTGLRVSELCSLVWGDVLIRERSGQLLVRQGKGNKARVVPLSLTARQAMWRWAAHSHALRVPSTKQFSQAHADVVMGWCQAHLAEPVFVSQKGGGLRPRSVQELIQQVAYHAKLPGVTPHTLRHTFAHTLLTAGATITEVAQLLGHASVTTTQIYTKTSAEGLQRVVERLAII